MKVIQHDLKRPIKGKYNFYLLKTYDKIFTMERIAIFTLPKTKKQRQAA